VCRSGSRTGVDWTGGNSPACRPRASLTEIPLHLRSHDAFAGRGPYMSGWQELRAEGNRRSLVRLTKALPLVFPRAVLSRALARPFIPPTPRLAIESYWGAHPIRADRLARALAARSQAPPGWTWRFGDRRSGLPFSSARRPRRTAKPHMQGVRDFVACVNRYIASAGTLTFGAPVPTGMRSGTVLVWSLGSSGMRQVARLDFCGVSKVGGALKAAGGCGGMPKRWRAKSRTRKEGVRSPSPSAR
jgi:hypothetical protein